MSFRLRNVPLLSRVGADRADHLRTDTDAAVAGWVEAALIRIDHRNQVLIAQGSVVLEPASELAASPPEDAVFLGRIRDGRVQDGRVPDGRTRDGHIRDGRVQDGRHVWAVRRQLSPHPTAEVLDLRRAGQQFDDVSAQLIASATALLNWHEQARFSPVDGTPTRPVRAGWARLNPLTGTEEFPRIDPAIICLVHDGHDRAVLARQALWPERLFSLIAGFVEAGESFETCVVREVAEEIGLTVHSVEYLGSQPWPFPRSLMVGFHAVGDPDQEFRFSDGEIAEADWFTRAEVRAALEAGDWRSDSTARMLLPGSISIAREIIESWAY
jgi:NAD+ diphosphatase